MTRKYTNTIRTQNTPQGIREHLCYSWLKSKLFLEATTNANTIRAQNTPQGIREDSCSFVVQKK